MFKIGIDLGGTKIEGVVLDQDNTELVRKRVETEQDKGYEKILENISKLYNNLVEKIAYEKHTFGIGTPGSISSRTGLLKNSNTVCMNGRPVKQDLGKILGRQIAIQNDANCFAMAEAIMGAGKGKDLVFGVIMGTGCGGGIVYKGEVITGQQSIAGEWGHMSIDPYNGPDCYCGKKGCIETYISGGGLERMYQKQSGEKKKFAEIVDCYRQGIQKDKEFMEQFFDRFGIAVSNLINILDPDLVVIGGGLSNIDELYTYGIEKVGKYIFNDELRTPIVKNELGDSAGVIGAAFIGV
jgi:fructokinase